MHARKWFIGPLSLATIAIVAVADLALPLMVDSSTKESVLIGLSFGQVGAVVVWAFAGTSLTWRRVAACYAASIVMSLYFTVCESRQADFATTAMMVTIWAAYATIALGLCLAARWLRHQQRKVAESDDEQPPRFGVRHLLLATTVIAVASLVVRYAIPELRDANIDTILILITQSAVLVLAAVELMRRSIATFVQLGGLAIVGFAGTVIMTTVIGWDDAAYANAIQVSILALVIVVPRLDRYKLRVHIEPREPKQPAELGTNQE